LEIKEIKLNLRAEECVDVESLCNLNLADTQKCWCFQISPFSTRKNSSIIHPIQFDIFSSAVPPMVWIQNQLVGSAIGQRISLECQSEAYPKSINYWMKNETIITLGNLIS
jgi:hypothetical protein